MLPAPEEPDSPLSALQTVADLPFRMMGRFAKPLAIGQCRDATIEGLSSKAAFERVRDLSLGLGALGMSAGDRVAIVAESRPDWILCDLAILAAGAITVPIYPTLAASQVRYILQDSGARLAVVSTSDQLEKLQQVRHLLPALEAVVVMDAAAGEAASVLTLRDAETRGHTRMTAEWGAGREFREAARRVKPSDLATIIYTSGTTGEPKGVMLTHANLTANIEAGSQVLALSEDDVALSFLPLSHAFERIVSFIYLLTGVQIVFAESMGSIGRDIGTVRPTVMTGVPRVYEKLQSRIMATGEHAGPTSETCSLDPNRESGGNRPRNRRRE
jgi:long-chain acyl-CoA synthetase